MQLHSVGFLLFFQTQLDYYKSLQPVSLTFMQVLTEQNNTFS